MVSSWSHKQRKVSNVTQFRSIGGKKIYTRVKRRTTSGKISILPGTERIKKNLISKGFLNPSKNKGKTMDIWTVLDEYEIVMKYRRIIIGIHNYYAQCDNISNLNFTLYVLTYSCAQTLAKKKKVSMKTIFNEYGKRIKINKEFQTKNGRTERSISLLTMKDLRKRSFATVRGVYDPFHLQRHWRTDFKIYQNCCICGNDEKNIGLHHLNSLRSISQGKRDRYEYIRSQINLGFRYPSV